MLLTSAGLGFVMSPSMNTGTAGVPPSDAGMASAVVNTGQQVGGSIGTSLLNTVAASAAASYLAAHLSRRTAAAGRPAATLLRHRDLAGTGAHVHQPTLPATGRLVP